MAKLKNEGISPSAKVKLPCDIALVLGILTSPKATSPKAEAMATAWVGVEGISSVSLCLSKSAVAEANTSTTCNSGPEDLCSPSLVGSKSTVASSVAA